MTPTQRIERLEDKVAAQAEQILQLSRAVRQLLEQQGQSPAAPADPLAQKEAEVRADACERGIVIYSAGIKEKDVATLLGKSHKTIHNWRTIDQPMNTTKVGRTHFYHPKEIAAYLLKNNTE